MKTAASTLAFLQTNAAFLVADLYTITLRDAATPLRFTGYDRDLTVGGATFLAPPKAPTITRDRLRNSRGLEVAELKVRLGVRPVLKIDGRTLALAAEQGVFDGAHVLIQRLVMPSPGDTSLTPVWWFEGWVSTVQATTSLVTLPVRCLREKLATIWPRRSYMPACPYAFGSPACGVDLDRRGFRIPNTVASGATTTTLPMLNPPSMAGSTRFGVVSFLSGPCKGLSRTISAVSGSTLTLAVALPAVPAAGDSLLVTVGCDKTVATCQNAYANLGNFGGFPAVPRPESVK